MPQSHAEPTQTVSGIHELTRTWIPDNPRADFVLVHGLGEHSGRYEAVGATLADAGFMVESFDLIGHGASGGTRADIQDWDQYLDQVQSHLEPRLANDRPTVLFGHSLGGLICASYLVSGRPLPDIAVLSAPALSGGAAWQRAASAKLASRLGGVRLPTGIKGEQLSRDPQVGVAYFDDPLVLTRATIRLADRMFTAMDRTLSAVPTISIPTLVIHGEADEIVPVSSSEVFEAVGTVSRKTLPDLRHESLNEPEGPEVLREVIEWMDAQL